MLRYLPIIVCILSIQTHCAFLMRKAKTSKATSLIISKRFKLPLARTLVYRMISPKNPFAELALAQHATECGPATQPGVLPNIKTLSKGAEYFVHIQNPSLTPYCYFMFDSQKDIRKIVEAMDPAHYRRDIGIDGDANIETVRWLAITKKIRLEEIYIGWRYKSPQTVLKWYMIDKRFVTEGNKI